jgi:type IV pilus assembly protein PilV
MEMNNAYNVDTDISIKNLKKQEGFTLIEVLVALTIFAVGLLAIAAMQTSAIRMNSSGNRLTEISTVGIDRLENLMSLPYSDPLLANGTRNDPAPPPGFMVTYNVLQDNPTINTKRITLTVTGNGKTLRMTTVRAQSL